MNPGPPFSLFEDRLDITPLTKKALLHHLEKATKPTLRPFLNRVSHTTECEPKLSDREIRSVIEVREEIREVLLRVLSTVHEVDSARKEPEDESYEEPHG